MPCPQDHPPYVRGLGTERYANTDLARPLCRDVRNHAVDSYHTKQQRHARGNGQHDHGKRGLRHRICLNFFQGLHVGERQMGIYRPNRLLELAQKTR